MAVKTLKISIGTSSIIRKIRRNLGIIGKRAKNVKGEALFTDLTTNTAEDPIFDDLLIFGAQNIVSNLVEMCNAYYEVDKDEDDVDAVVSFVITSPRVNTSDSVHDILTGLVTDYLYNFCLARYLSAIHPQVGEKYPPLFGQTYTDACVTIITNIKAVAFTKREVSGTGSYSKVGMMSVTETGGTSSTTIIDTYTRDEIQGFLAEKQDKLTESQWVNVSQANKSAAEAMASAEDAENALETIKEEIDNLDVSESTEEQILALNAKIAVNKADINQNAKDIAKKVDKQDVTVTEQVSIENVKIGTITSEEGKGLAEDGTITETDHSLYTLYTIVLTEDVKLYFTNDQTYNKAVIELGYIKSGVQSIRYRIQEQKGEIIGDDTLPKVNAPLELEKGDTLYITYITSIVTSFTTARLNFMTIHAGDPMIAENISLAESQVKQVTDIFLVTKTTTHTSQANAENPQIGTVVSEYGMGIGDDGTPTADYHSDYYLFTVSVQYPSKVWFVQSEQTNRLVVECSVKKDGIIIPKRYRAVQSEGQPGVYDEYTLPALDDESNPPLELSEGDTLYIACPKAFIEESGASNLFFHAKYTTTKYSFKYADETDSSMIGKCLVKYEEGSEAQPSILNIYTPTNSGYIRYKFGLCVNASINSNVWRMIDAYTTDKNLTALTALTTNGEWECAVHLEGRADFSGGSAHGDEVFSSFALVVGGRKVEASTLTTLTVVDEIRAYQTSSLYDPNDSTTIFATHTSEHIWNKEGLTINQTLKWLLDENVTTSYLAMFPMAKTAFEKFCTDLDYTPKDNYTTNTTVDGVKSIKSWKEETGTLAEFKVTRFTQDANKFIMGDNGGGAYYKCYYCNIMTANHETGSGIAVKAGTVWQTTTVYHIVAADEEE